MTFLETLILCASCAIAGYVAGLEKHKEQSEGKFYE